MYYVLQSPVQKYDLVEATNGAFVKSKNQSHMLLLTPYYFKMVAEIWSEVREMKVLRTIGAQKSVATTEIVMN